MNKVLSILLTVYNQRELLEKNLKEIIKYKGNDIEIVVSDNGSTENIYDAIQMINDPRIKLFRGLKNVGHDRNIINGIEQCKAPYVFLLRTRDLILPDKIELVINTIKKNQNCSYFLFSTTEEPGYSRMALEDKTYKSGSETIKATYKLLIHPSGHIYKKSDLRTDVYRNYIDRYFQDNNFAFCVHELIRMDLAISGDFKTSDQVVWRVAKSLEAKDKATTSVGRGISPYDPELQYPRYECELIFAYNEIGAPNNLELCKEIIASFLYRITYKFSIYNRTRVEASHYGAEVKDFSITNEIKRFKERTVHLLDDMDPVDRKIIRQYLRKQLIINSTYYCIRDVAHKLIKE